MPSADEPEKAKVVLDPNDLEPKGGTAIDWFVPSPDGKLVAVSLSQKGSEDGTLNFYRTDTGEHLADQIPRVQFPTGGGSAAWVGDYAVFYTRYPHAGERPAANLNFYQQIYFHELGESLDEDQPAFDQPLPRIAEIALESSPNNQFVLASVANGDGGEFAHYLLEIGTGSRRWAPITRFQDKVKAVRFGRKGELYLLSVRDAPHGKVLFLPAWGGIGERSTIDGSPEGRPFSGQLEDAPSSARGTSKRGGAKVMRQGPVPKLVDAKVIVPETKDAVIEA